MSLFLLSDDEYAQRFDLEKLTEMYVEKMEELQPQTQADVHRASLEFFRSISTGSAIKGLSWTQIVQRELFMRCYIHLFAKVCADVQPHSKQDWIDVCTFLIQDVPHDIVETVLEAYALKNTRFRPQIHSTAELESRQVLGELATYSQRLPDQIVDKAQWFVAYFKYMQSIEQIKKACDDLTKTQQDASFNAAELMANLSVMQNHGDSGGYTGCRFTGPQLRLALDRTSPCTFLNLLAELLYMLTSQ